MAQIRCSGILFDLDGVLVDSTPAVARAWTKWCRKHGFDADEIVLRAHGRPSSATVRELLPDASPAVHEAESAEMEQNELTDLDGVVPLPGALQLLQSLPPHRWTIVTSCSRPLAQARIHAAGLPLPQQLVTADDVLRGKPDPEPYRKGAESLALAPSDCIVVEDAPAGIRSGKASRASVLALRTTAADPELSAAGADWIITDLNSLRLHSSDGNHHIALSLLD